MYRRFRARHLGTLVAIVSMAASALFLVSELAKLFYENHLDDERRHLLFDPKSTKLNTRLIMPMNLVMAAKEITHEDDKLCIALVDDGDIKTASVISEDGQFRMSLPENHEAQLSMECTEYTRVQMAEEESVVSATYTEEGGVMKQGGYYELPSGYCDRKYFRPGHYSQRIDHGTWIDHCTGRQLSTRRVNNESESLLAEDKCPIVAHKKETIWVSFIGDSMTRMLFKNGLDEIGLSTKRFITSWGSQRSGNPYYYLAQQTEKVWFSYMFNFIVPESGGQMNWQVPFTWGDFIEMRGEGPRDDDPNFPNDKVPDIVFFSPGYHASVLNSHAYGAAIERTLSQWQDTHNAHIPHLHLMLNMMPAPWLIPDKYTSDRQHRTLLNEYRKNLAIIAAAKKFDFVKSVVDFFSIELPFNGRPGRTAHIDAVHVTDHRILRILGGRVIETLCNSDQQLL